jgi:hypothetical protein
VSGQLQASAREEKVKVEIKVKVKIKVKFTLEHATKAQRGSRGIALLSI